MSYTLWSRDRLVGRTNLDLGRLRDHTRIGFVDPTEEGKQLLADAASVPAAAYALARAAERAADKRRTRLKEYADFCAACDRRESLELELRDDSSIALACEWIQIRDIDDHSYAKDFVDDEPDEVLDPELEAAIEHDVAIVDSWFPRRDDTPPPEADDPWISTRYEITVHFGKRARPREVEDAGESRSCRDVSENASQPHDDID